MLITFLIPKRTIAFCTPVVHFLPQVRIKVNTLLLNAPTFFSLGPLPYFIRSSAYSQTKPGHIFSFFSSHLQNGTECNVVLRVLQSVVTCSCCPDYLGLWITIILLEQEMPLAFVCSPCRNHCDTFQVYFSWSNDSKPKLNQEGREVLSRTIYQYQGSHFARINLWVRGLSFLLSDAENAKYTQIQKFSSWVHQSQALVNSIDLCIHIFIILEWDLWSCYWCWTFR